MKKHLPLLDIISRVKGTTENISATHMKNRFEIKCLYILNWWRSINQINCNEKIYIEKSVPG